MEANKLSIAATVLSKRPKTDPIVLNRKPFSNNKKMKRDYDNEENDDFAHGATTNTAQSISLGIYSTYISRSLYKHMNHCLRYML